MNTSTKIEKKNDIESIKKAKIKKTSEMSHVRLTNRRSQWKKRNEKKHKMKNKKILVNCNGNISQIMYESKSKKEAKKTNTLFGESKVYLKPRKSKHT